MEPNPPEKAKVGYQKLPDGREVYLDEYGHEYASKNAWKKVMKAKKYRKPQKFTHFISLPVMHSEDLKSRYCAWRDQILAKADTYNETIIDKIFMKPEILHYTFLMLPLGDDGKVEAC